MDIHLVHVGRFQKLFKVRPQVDFLSGYFSTLLESTRKCRERCLSFVVCHILSEVGLWASAFVCRCAELISNTIFSETHHWVRDVAKSASGSFGLLVAASGKFLFCDISVYLQLELALFADMVNRRDARTKMLKQCRTLQKF
jgi:hypothetical protein